MNRPLRIVHTENSCGWGGQEIRILTEMRGMLDRGHQLTLLCPREAAIHDAAIKLGIPTVALPIARKKLGGVLAMRGWLAQHGSEVDVINCHSSTDSWLSATASTLLAKAPPIVRTRHVSTAVNNAATTRWLYLKATRHIVTTGERLRQQLHRDNGYPLEHMTSIPTGIDLDRYQPRPRTEMRAELGLPERPTLGIVATLRGWKGHQYLFDAWRELQQRFPDWQLVVVGHGPQWEALNQRARDEGFGERVRFVGNRDDVEKWLGAFDLFVLPSWGNEGVPQGIMQAMATGLPVVSTTVGAIDEAVAADETGFLVGPRDAVALTAALDRLMGNEALRRQFGEAGLQRARRQFGLDHMLDRMLTVFEAACAGTER
ncbi:glycosyltransferase family 4 protein [Chitinimonas lacunae]|uniref:Glycosyltransferase family 4 protein n=1 Tax=Chitinimonas lacunae TaxID=1963018 RepID=A0ABV8MRY0_9NEIS